MSVVVLTEQASWWLVEADVPGRGAEAVGVLLLHGGSLRLKFRRDWDAFADEEDAEVLRELAADLDRKAAEMGPAALLASLEDTLSDSIRLSERRETMAADPDRALGRLYREHVRVNVLPFRTHLPRYTLRVAAGKFLENDEVSEEGWEETPGDLRLTPDMFVARIAGHSMEPHIPDGSLAVFRAGVSGSRSGRLVLVENLELTGTNRYTVKRYRSAKAPSGESEWSHSRIWLESLNPAYSDIELDPDQEKYRIIAEFVRVLE